MPVYEITSFRGGISDYEDKGISGAFKFGSGLDIRKQVDSLSAGQALVDEGTVAQSASSSYSPSSSISPSGSNSPSNSASRSPSASASPSLGGSASKSPSASRSPSASNSPSASSSPSSSISFSPSPSAVYTSIFRGLILWFVKCTDGHTYGFDNTGRIYKRVVGGSWSQVYDAGQRITGAAEWFADTGKSYLYFATRTNLHRKEIPGLSNWNDVNVTGNFPKTNLMDNDWHTMAEAGGNLIIANNTNLALIGYDESYTNDALNLVPGNAAKTIVERNGRTIVGSARISNPDRGVNGAIDAEYPLAQIGDDGELFYSDMNDTMPIKKFPGGGKVNPGGVTNEVEYVNFFEWEQTALTWIDKQSVGNLSLWGVYGADSGKTGVYSFGRKNKNHPFVLNLDHILDVDEIGAITNVDGVLLVSYRDGVDFGVKALSTTLKGQGVYEGLDFKAPVKKPANITTWDYAELYMAPLPTGCTVQFWYRINKTGVFVQAQLADGSGTSFSTVGGEKAVYRIVEKGEIFEPKVIINPSANTTPEVYRIRTYFN